MVAVAVLVLAILADPVMEGQEFALLWREAMKAALAEDVEQLDHWLDVAQHAIDADNPRAESLTADLDELAMLELGELAQLRNAVANLRPTEVVSPGLMIRCLERQAWELVGKWELDGAGRAAQLAVEWADEHCGLEELCFARLNLVQIRRHLIRNRIHEDSVSREVYQETMDCVEELGFPEFGPLVAFCEAVHVGTHEQQVQEALGLLSDEVVEQIDDLQVQVEARCYRTLIRIEQGDFKPAAADCSWLEENLLQVSSDADLSLVGSLLGRFHRGRVEFEGESEVERLEAADRGFTLWADHAANRYQYASALEWRANIRASTDRLEDARRDLEVARQIFREQGATVPLARILGHDAYCAYRAGDLTRSLRMLKEQREALEELDPLPLESLCDNLKLLAFVCHSSNDTEQGLQGLLELIALEDEVLRQAERGFELPNASEATETHGYLLHLLAEENAPGSPNEVFALATAVVEHGRARLLRRALLEQRGQLDSPSPNGVKLRPLRQLPQDVMELRWSVSRIADTRGEIDRYVLLARCGDQQILTDLGPKTAIDEQVGQFLAGWFAPQALARTPQEYQREGLQLSKLIFGEALGLLRACPAEVNRLLLMTDGELERLPFSALLFDPGPGQPQSFAELPYLIRRFAPVHVPSLAVLSLLPRPANQSAMLLLEGAAERGSGLGHLALRFAAVERAGLARDHTDLQLVSDVRENSLEGVLKQRPYGWLHFIAHAEADPDQRGAAALFLRGQKKLGVTEVVQLPLATGARVVLSACGTATGEFHRGEGVQGLWRAFLLAGASCVVSTLYEVDDRSAAAWMQSFHRWGRQLPAVSQALQRASQDWLRGEGVPAYPRGSLVRDPAHPFLWAAYVVVGEDGGPGPR
jgi:CHAT domain-containing protein